MQIHPSLEAEKAFTIIRTRPSVLGQSYYLLIAANFASQNRFEGRTLVLSPTGGIESPLCDYRFEHDDDEAVEAIFGPEAFFDSMLESAKLQLLGHYWELIDSGRASYKITESPHLFEEVLDHKTALTTIILREDPSFRSLLVEFANDVLDSSMRDVIEKLVKASNNYVVTRKK